MPGRGLLKFERAISHVFSGGKLEPPGSTSTNGLSVSQLALPRHVPGVLPGCHNGRTARCALPTMHCALAAPFKAAHAPPARVVRRGPRLARVACALSVDLSKKKVAETRRSLLRGAGALLTVTQLPRPALAEEATYTDGPEGIKYADLTVGKGDSPFEGDGMAPQAFPPSCSPLSTLPLVSPVNLNERQPLRHDGTMRVRPLHAVLKANYVLNVDGNKVDYAKFFVFSAGVGEVIKGWDMCVMGSGDMPPMKVGGIRKALIPPGLAYGAKGAGCRGDGSCSIPPDSTLEFTIELVGIK